MGDLIKGGGTKVGVPRRREKVIEILNDSFANNLFELDEFEARIEKAEGAKCIEELDALINDLPAEMAAAASDVPENYAPLKKEQALMFIMGEKTVSGLKLPGANSSLKNIMSSLTMDYRKVEMKAGLYTLDVVNLMADMTIIVPPDVTVVNEMRDIMASATEDPLLNKTKNRRGVVIRFTGLNLMASLKIRVQP